MIQEAKTASSVGTRSHRGWTGEIGSGLSIAAETHIQCQHGRPFLVDRAQLNSRPGAQVGVSGQRLLGKLSRSCLVIASENFIVIEISSF